MKETEYFKRAATDAAFRKVEIEQQRYFMEVSKVLFWFLGASLVVFPLYCAVTSEREAATSEFLLLTVLGTSFYGSCKTRLAGLEALEDPKPSPGLEKMNAASPHR
jgi:hypothetical protein